ncbi:MAG: response regulator [Patescibacteria group bacterium]|nr:response regulator [Patescibacteria group bacterium]
MTNKKTILIAEDEAAMLAALSKKFIGAGFNVLEAKDGEEALVKAFDKKPDLVMLDIIMPKIEGIEVMKKIRKSRQWGGEVPIIMLTNLSDSDSVSEATKFRVYDFLVKTDWRLDDIVNLVKAKLNL